MVAITFRFALGAMLIQALGVESRLLLTIAALVGDTISDPCGFKKVVRCGDNGV